MTTFFVRKWFPDKPILENVRKQLRSLVKFVEKTRRINVYTDFLDLIGEEREIELPGLSTGLDMERFRDKTEQYLRAHQDDPVIHKLRWNERLTEQDLDNLEKMLLQAGGVSAADLKKVRSKGELGLFVRRMVGMDREAAKRAFDGFLNGRTLSGNQIHFINLVVNYLTQGGWMRPSQLYESPFTDFSPRGIEGVFNPEEVSQLVGILETIRPSAS